MADRILVNVSRTIDTMDVPTQTSASLIRIVLDLVRSPRLLFLCFVLYRVLLPIYRITLHPLAGYPGPKLWQISRIPWHVALLSGNLHRRMLEFHDKYGPIVRVAPNELSYAHADAWRDIYGDKTFERNDVWFQQPAHMPVNIIGSNELAYARLRRGFHAAFTDAGVKEMSTTVATYVDLMVRKLGEVVDRGNGENVVDLVNWMNFTLFDISGDLSFGEDFGSIENAKAHPWVEISLQFGIGVAMVVSINCAWPFNKILFALMPKNFRSKFDPDAVPKDIGEKFAYHQRLTKHKVGKRLAAPKDRVDFIASVEKYNAEMMKKGSKEKIVTREELDHNMTVFIFAGSDTTSSVLSGTLSYLLKDERVYRKLQKEIRDTFATEEDITVAAVTKMHYVTAILNEGLRLVPAIVIGIPRQVPKGRHIVCGKTVPGGTFVAVNHYAANRASFNFVKPEEFLPERFMPEGRIAADNMEMFQPFFTGRHICVGHRLAWVMMRLILTKLVFAFDMELIDRDQVGDFGQQKAYLFWVKEPLMVKLKKRYQSGR